MPPADGGIKLSKAALCTLKHPDGIGVIHDISFLHYPCRENTEVENSRI